MGLNTVAAYLLLVLGGQTPSADSIASVISAGGGESDSAAAELLLKELDGKDVNELIAEGKELLKSVTLGGGGGVGGGAAAAPAAGAAAEAPKEEKKKKEEPEEEVDLGAGSMFGGGGDGY